MKVLLTGHRGFIGHAVHRHLSDAGFEIATLGQTRRGKPNAVAEIVATCPDAAAVVHCAADIRRNDTAATLRTNCLGTEQLIAAAIQLRATRFIFLSSTSVYAASSEPMCELSPLAPADTYAASKLFGEYRVLASAPAPLCLRVPSPIGPGTPENRLVTRWLRRLLAGQSPDVLGCGGKVQHYVDVRDIARAIRFALEKPHVTSVFNIAGAAPVSNLELAAACIATTRPDITVEFDPRPDPDDTKRFVFNTEKIAQELAFIPGFSLSDSLSAHAAELENPIHR